MGLIPKRWLGTGNILSILYILFVFIRAGQIVYAQGEDEFLTLAVQLAHKVQRDTRVPSSVVVAQAVLETAWGQRPIADTNNYFGIKAFERPDGSINLGQYGTGWAWAWTSEWDGTQYVSTRERFRSYNSMADSFDDLGRLYSQNARYAAAMEQAGDPRRFAQEIAKAGFATAPDYASRLVVLMDKEDLYQYDLKPDDAEFVDQSDYPTVHPGQSFEIYFELRNAGANTWRVTDDYHLQSVNRLTLGVDPRQKMAEDIPPDQSVRWTIQMVAPAQPGRYRTTWQLEHGDQFFGPELFIDITVEPAPSVADTLGAALALLAGAGLLALLAWFLFNVRARARNL